MSYTEKFYIGGTAYTTAVKRARLNLKTDGPMDSGTFKLAKGPADTIGAFSVGMPFSIIATSARMTRYSGGGI